MLRMFLTAVVVVIGLTVSGPATAQDFDFEKGVAAFTHGDYAEGARWMKLAAEQGHADAQRFLRDMYGDGLGVPQDYVTAYMWLNLAAAQGSDGAVNARSIVAEQLTGAGLETAQRLSRECLARQYKGC